MDVSFALFYSYSCSVILKLGVLSVVLRRHLAFGSPFTSPIARLPITRQEWENGDLSPTQKWMEMFSWDKRTKKVFLHEVNLGPGLSEAREAASIWGAIYQKVLLMGKWQKIS